jgi:hypothetical protein
MSSRARRECRERRRTAEEAEKSAAFHLGVITILGPLISEKAFWRCKLVCAKSNNNSIPHFFRISTISDTSTPPGHDARKGWRIFDSFFLVLTPRDFPMSESRFLDRGIRASDVFLASFHSLWTLG